MSSLLDSYASAYQSEFAYDLDNYFLLKRTCERTLALACQGSVLDLGVGHGYSMNIFSKFFDDYQVIEGSQVVIDQFLEKNTDFKGVITQTFFENYETSRRFDSIIMNFILEHVEDPLGLLKKFKGLLKEDGSIIMTVPNFEALNKRIALEANLIEDMSVLSEADKQLGHFRLFSVDTFKTLIKDAGLKIEALEGIFLKPLTTNQLQSLNLAPKIWEAMANLGQNYPELSVGMFAKVTL